MSFRDAPAGAEDRRRCAAVTAGIVALISYGSLFPFQFHVCSGGPLQLLATSPAPASRDDLLSNILLYLPLGFFATRTFSGSRLAQLSAMLTATLGGAALSVSLELAQYCDQGRVSSIADVLANGAGALAGSVASMAAGANLSFPLILAACWVGTRTLPYLPAFDPAKWRAAVGPLIETRPQPLDIFHFFALWLAAAAAVDAIAGRRRWMLAGAVFLVFAARILVVDLSLTPAEILGAAIAFGTWNALRIKPWRIKAVAVIFAAFIVEQALEPFQFLSAPRPFGWVPFYTFMTGPRENGSRVFLEKSFMYGSLVWLAVLAGMPFRASALLATALVLGLRLAQVYLPGRSAEVTDPVMVAMMAALLAALPNPRK